ncbi:defensin alpha 4-like [Saccopteryx bilineata]|uniref:defensin alpha 4-like n=1 Tax=Saccopteryx bilineata TaxID=59482 RepID=UPI00338F8BCF
MKQVWTLSPGMPAATKGRGQEHQRGWEARPPWPQTSQRPTAVSELCPLHYKCRLALPSPPLTLSSNPTCSSRGLSAMKTLALLAALLLLAFQAQAEPLRETADQKPAQDQPEAEDQDVAISFIEEERVAREVSGLRRVTVCTCRNGRCNRDERLSGSCRKNGRLYNLCSR